MSKSPFLNNVLVPAAAAAVLTATVAHAAAPDGVWSGTLGDRAIVACFEATSGSYYDVTSGRGVMLAAVDGKAGAYTEERGARPRTGGWQLTATDSALSGDWTSADGKQTAKLALARVASNEEHPCASEAFNGPRLGAVARTPGKESKPSGVHMRQFSALGGNMKGVEIVDPGVALDPTRALVERFNRDVTLQYLECVEMFEAQSELEGEADFDGTVALELVAPRWVVLSQATNYFCGNAHPESTFGVLTFQRDTGVPVDPATWLTSDPNVIGHRFVKGKGECAAVVAEAQFAVWPTKKGLAFMPAELPHVVAACTDTVVVPWKKLAKDLTPAGQSAAAEFMKLGATPK